MKVPLVPTIFVAVVVAALVGLGVWQLHRAEWKEGLLVRYRQAATLPPVAWPVVPSDPEPLYFRRTSGFCLEVVGWRAIAGRNDRNEPGWAHIAQCRTGAEGPGMQVDIGWSRSSNPPAWRGGEVHGVIVPDSRHKIRLVATNPAPGLRPSAPMSVASIPNNHRGYAVQWFLFAAIAVIIYLVALRRRQKEQNPPDVAGPPPTR